MTQPSEEPNKFNGLTRYDTFNIRPDLFQALKQSKVAQTQALFDALSGAGADAAKVTDDLKKLNSQLQGHGESAPGGLIPAYIASNTRRWELQEKVDEAQNDILKVQSDAQEIMARKTSEEIENIRALVDSLRESQQARMQAEPRVFTVYDGRVNAENDHLKAEFYGGIPTTAKFTAKGSWKGRVEITRATPESEAQKIALKGWTVPNPDGTRELTWTSGLFADWYQLQYTIEKGVQRTRDYAGGATNTPQSTWYKHDNQAFTAKVAGAHMIYWEVTWNAATYHNRYGIRVTTSTGRTLQTWGPYDKIGPLLPGFDGSRTHWIRLSDIQLQAGEKVFFETHTDATEANQRAIRSTMTKLSWIEQ